jgi:hypothetical protein
LIFFWFFLFEAEEDLDRDDALLGAFDFKIPSSKAMPILRTRQE